MTKTFGESLLRLARAGDKEGMLALCRDVRRLASRASPGGAARLMRRAENPQELARIARFVEREPAGAFALHVAGGEGAQVVKGAERAGAGAERALVMAAGKGERGVAWLRTGAWRVLARPHPLVGLAKGLWKGNVEKLAAQVASALDPRAWWLVPLLGAWTFLELALLGRRLGLGARGDAGEDGGRPAVAAA
jgi:hypothetical protein